MSLRLLVLLFLCIYTHLPSHTFTGGPVKPASRWRVSWAARAFLPLHSHATTFSHTHRRACRACKQAACLLGCSCFLFLCIYTHLPSHTFTGGPVKPASRQHVSWAARAFLPLHSDASTFSHIHRKACQACKQVACLLGCLCFSSSALTRKYLLTHSQEGLSSLQAGGVSLRLLVLFFLCIHAQLPSHTLTGGPVKPASRQRVSWAACAFLPLHSHASTFSHIHRRACQACKQAACLLGC